MDTSSGIQRYMLTAEADKPAVQEIVQDAARSMKRFQGFVVKHVELIFLQS